MPILYRVQTRPVTDDTKDTPQWLTEWVALRADALTKHDELDALGWPTITTKHDIPGDRDSLCMALNLCAANFTVLPGEQIKRTEPC